VRKSSQGSYDVRRSWKVFVNDEFDGQYQMQDGRRSCKKDGGDGESEPFKLGGAAGYSGVDQPQARKAFTALHLFP
jgi:hypothetical protein